MDKTIKKHLERRGVFTTEPTREELSFSERNADFFRWFEESVMGFDSEKYRREFWREARRHGYTIGHVPYGFKERMSGSRCPEFGLLTYLAAMGVSFFIWAVRREVDRHVRRLRRPTYYEAERDRRRALAEERRRIRLRSTLNPCPAMEDIRAALAAARRSPKDMLRLGSLMEDLECYVDNSVYFAEDGSLKGRRGGIRRLLANEAPDLYAKYKTLMRYKAMSKRFRQATGTRDPIPTSALLPPEGEGNAPGLEVERVSASRELISDQDLRRGSGCEVAEGEAVARRCRKGWHAEQKGGIVAWPGDKEAIAAAWELLACCEGTAVSLMAQLEMRIGPDYVPHAPHGAPAGTSPDTANHHRVA